jgi:tetratricopeptide (TPR) repeat protein
VKTVRLLILIFTLTGAALSGQNSFVDSVAIKISTLPDSSIAKALNDSSKAYRFEDFDLSYAFAQKALGYAQKSKSWKQTGNAYNFSGIAQQLMAHYPKALENYMLAEATFRKAGYKKGLASTYINIGVLNQDMGNPKSSIEYNRKAYGISLDIGDSVNAAAALNNIATIHSDLNNLDSALFYNLKSLEIRKKLKDPQVISTSLSNIGSIYDAQKKYAMAMDYERQAIAIDSTANNKKSLCISMSNYGNTLTKVNRSADAKKVLLRAMDCAKEIEYKELQLDIAANLIATCEKLSELDEALGYSQFYIALKDSLTDEDTRNSYAEMQAKLDNTVQKHEIENYQKDKIIAAEKDEKKNLIIYSGAGAIILFSVLLIIIFRGYNQKKKINVIITRQKHEVEIQKDIIEEKNKAILDSIHYAERIQKSLMPTDSYVEKSLKRLKKE